MTRCSATATKQTVPMPSTLQVVRDILEEVGHGPTLDRLMASLEAPRSPSVQRALVRLGLTAKVDAAADEQHAHREGGEA